MNRSQIREIWKRLKHLPKSIKQKLKTRYLSRDTGSLNKKQLVQDLTIIVTVGAGVVVLAPLCAKSCKIIKSKLSKKFATKIEEDLSGVILEIDNNQNVSNWSGKKCLIGGILIITFVGSAILFNESLEDFGKQIGDYFKTNRIEVEIDINQEKNFNSYAVGTKPFSAYDTQDWANAGATGVFYSSLLLRRILIRWALYGLTGSPAANVLYDVCFGSHPVFGPMMPIPIVGTEDPSAFMVFSGYLNRTIVCVLRGSKYLIFDNI
jgi:hypothetical protein